MHLYKGMKNKYSPYSMIPESYHFPTAHSACSRPVRLQENSSTFSPSSGRNRDHRGQAWHLNSQAHKMNSLQDNDDDVHRC